MFVSMRLSVEFSLWQFFVISLSLEFPIQFSKLKSTDSLHEQKVLNRHFVIGGSNSKHKQIPLTDGICMHVNVFRYVALHIL